MSQSKLPSRLSLKLGASNLQESFTDVFLKTATDPTFPIFHIKLTTDISTTPNPMELHLDPKFYKMVKTTMFTDDLVFYYSGNSQFEQWSSDMVIAFKILHKLGMFASFEEWIQNSRDCLELLLDDKKIQTDFPLDSARQTSEDFLSSLDLLNGVNETEILFQASETARNEQTMDASTMIYRLAMAIYHSNLGSGTSLFAAVDDPSSSYLRFTKSGFFENRKEVFSEMMKAPLNLRINIMKVLITFVISVYVYYKVDKS